MENIIYNQILILIFQCFLVATLLLFLFRLRILFGLGLFYIAIGLFKFMHYFYTQAFAVEILPGINVSIGSTVMYSGVLFSILLIYIREDAVEARKVIYALMIFNIFFAILLYSTSLGIGKAGFINRYNLPLSFFKFNLRALVTETVVLFLDSILIIILYEAFSRLLSSIFLRIFLTMTIVLVTHSILFSLGISLGKGNFNNYLAASLFSKLIAVPVYSVTFWIYLIYFEKRLAVKENTRNRLKEIYNLFTYRQKIEKLKMEKAISEGQLQKIIAEKTIELEKTIRRFTILSSVRELRMDKSTSFDLVSEFLLKVKEAFGVDACTIHLIRGNQLVLLSHEGICEEELEKILPLSHPYLEEIIQKKESLAIENISEDAKYRHINGNGFTKFHYTSCAGAPLLVGEKVTGVLKIYSIDSIRKFTSLELEHLQMVASQLAHKYENAMLFEQNEKHKEVLVKEITARKKAEEKIKQSNERFELIGRAANDALWEWNLETGELWGNEEHQKLYGLTLTDPVPVHDTWKNNIHEDDRKRIIESLENTLASDRNSWEAEYRLYTSNKGWINIYDRTYIERNAGGKPVRVLGTMMDITERKRAEEEILEINDQLRKLSAHLQHIREEERKRIGREIHDDLGQQLTAIKMDVAWIDKKTPEEETLVKTKLKNIIGLLDDSNQSVRRILNELKPSILDEYGLLDAIEWKSKEITEISGIPVIFNSTVSELKLPDESSNCIYRVFQESLTNIIRYAKASQVIVSLRVSGETIQVSITDDGTGFDTAEFKNKNSFGILGMTERVKSLGGKFELTSFPGKGTNITIILPYKG